MLLYIAKRFNTYPFKKDVFFLRQIAKLQILRERAQYYKLKFDDKDQHIQLLYLE